MRLVFLCKYINCAVDKNTGSDSGHATYIYKLYYQLKYKINILILFVSSCCKPLKSDPYGEICTCPTWRIPFLPNAHPHNWFMPATAQLENFYYYK